MHYLLFSYNSYLFFFLPHSRCLTASPLERRLQEFSAYEKKNVAVNDISLRAAVTNYALASWRFRFLRRFVISHTRNSSHWLRIILQRDIQSH